MKPAKKMYFMACNVAGLAYYEAYEVWDKLKLGTELCMEHEKGNAYDANAVVVYYHDEATDEDTKLGYIPRSKNEDLVKFLDMGWASMFELRISSICNDCHPEEKIQITIKIKRNPDEGRDAE